MILTVAAVAAVAVTTTMAAVAVTTTMAAVVELFTMGLYRARWEGATFMSFGLGF